MQHIAGRKHRKFAVDDANFLQLDYILARVKRRTVEEVKQEESDWKLKCSEPRSSDDEDSAATTDYDMFEGALVDLDS